MNVQALHRIMGLRLRSGVTIDKVFGGFTNVLHIGLQFFTIKKLHDS
jgi:hypothetical protein